MTASPTRSAGRGRTGDAPASELSGAALAPTVPPDAAHGWPVWGHDEAANDLRNQIARQNVRHAYLISGPASVGKTALAIAFAQSLSCLNPPSRGVPCLECRSCRKISRGVHPDVQTVSLETQAAAAEKAGTRNTALTIETIREVCSMAGLRPMEGQWRILIIDDAETMQDVAQEALLKTLEEPPGFMVMMLLSDDAEALLPTIRSRCQQIDLRLVNRTVIAEMLRVAGVAAATADELAALAGGKPGWAMRAAQDTAVLNERQETVQRALGWIASGSYDRLVTALRYGENFSKQRDQIFADLETLLGVWRDMLLLQAGQETFVTYRVASGQLASFVRSWSLADIHKALSAVQTCIADLHSNVRPRLALEQMVLQWPIAPNSNR